MTKQKEQINGFLGKETEFEGKLSFAGTVRIDGPFSGEISSEGTLIIGESSVLNANVHAHRIIVSGEINGNVQADGKIEINASGKVIGDMDAPVISVQEGAVFEGSCRMRKDRADDDNGVKIAQLHQESV